MRATMLDRDNLLGFALLAMDMRDRQKVYYKTRTQTAMITMWEAQKLFDRRRRELFGSPDEPSKPEEPRRQKNDCEQDKLTPSIVSEKKKNVFWTTLYSDGKKLRTGGSIFYSKESAEEAAIKCEEYRGIAKWEVEE